MSIHYCGSDLTIHPYRHSTQARRTLTTFDGISPKYKLNEMTEAEKMTTMRAVSQVRNKRLRVDSPTDNVQPLSQVQRSDIRKSKTAEKSQPTLQLSASQSSNIQSFEPNHRLLTQPIALHTLEPQAEDDQISHRITQLFEEDPDVADDVLDSANSSKRPLIPNAHHLVELSIPPAMHIDALRQSSLEVAFSQVPQPQPECLLPPRCSSPTYPDPTLHQLTLTTPPKNRGGFLYDGPYPQLEHDWEGEVRMYEDQKKEARRKERKAKLAANPPTYPFASISDQPPSSIGYGKAMGNGGVGTLDYLGIRWESGEKERRGVQDHCIED